MHITAEIKRGRCNFVLKRFLFLCITIFYRIKQLTSGENLSTCQIFGDPKMLENLKLRDLHPASWYVLILDISIHWILNLYTICSLISADYFLTLANDITGLHFQVLCCVVSYLPNSSRKLPCCIPDLLLPGQSSSPNSLSRQGWWTYSFGLSSCWFLELQWQGNISSLQ